MLDVMENSKLWNLSAKVKENASSHMKEVPFFHL